MDLRLVLFEISRMLESVDGILMIPSSKLGSVLGVSQQTASRYLSSLEKKGLIKRVIRKKGQDISLTKEGISVLEDIYSNLGFLIKGDRILRIEGSVSIGLGEGAYYIRMYSCKIEKELGFRPFYGTLNVNVSVIPKNIRRFTFKSIPAFKKDGRSFGGIDLARLKLTSGKKAIDCFLLLPERTHHTNELEIISRENLRKSLNLSNGSPVLLELS
ncbi:MAG: DUF120 domain-containing protein [Candidatus Altiarchaeota archaeon]